MSDLISRKALIESVKTWDMQDLYLPTHFIDLIEDEPSVTDTNVGGKWTLCSKKLPEGCGDAELEVLVYTEEKYIEAEFKEVGVALYYPGEKKFRSVYNHRADITENVVAWMYKPEPYKGE